MCGPVLADRRLGFPGNADHGARPDDEGPCPGIEDVPDEGLPGAGGREQSEALVEAMGVGAVNTDRRPLATELGN